MTTVQIEEDLQHQYLTCQECGELVKTVTAESIPAQQLRHGSCGHDFFMDMSERPRYPMEVKRQ